MLKLMNGWRKMDFKMEIKKKKPKFVRTDTHKYSKLGVRRKKKQVYRKGKGIDNKYRLKKKGHLRNVSIGFRSNKKTRGLVKGFIPVKIINTDDLKNLKENEIGIISKIGNKKKIIIAEYALKNKTRLMNLNPKKFLDKIESLKKIKSDESKKRATKRKDRDKKAKEAEKKKEEDSKKEEKKDDKSNLEDTVNRPDKKENEDEDKKSDKENKK